jgi:hypothetical protein
LSRITSSDIVLICLIAATGIYFLADNHVDTDPGRKVVVRTIEGDLHSFDLNQERAVEIAGLVDKTRILISEGTVSFVSSPCPHKICVRKGRISKPGEWIACVPNGVMAYISGQADYDGITP